MNVGMCFDRSLPVPLVEQLVDAGADDVAFFPGPTVELARKDLEHVSRLAAALGN